MWFLAWSFSDIFGVGETAKAVASVTQAGTELAWKAMLLHAIEANVQVLLIMITIICAVVCLAIAGYLAMRFAESCREALADGKVTWSEGIVLSLQTVISLPVISALVLFGFFLAWASRSGLLELIAIGAKH